jgi:phosphoglucosamine mutase
VVISASHNPFEDNGIKFFSATGTKLPDEVELAIEAALDQPMKTASSKQLGRVKRVDDAAGRYIEFCKSTFPNDLDLRGMRIVVDCANGAGYHIAPHVFHELGADVVAIGNEPNGMNINKECGATHTEALSRAVRKHRADVGIALDGDGDRLMMTDATGQVMDGDKLIYAIARYRKETGQPQLGGVVGTLMTNLGAELALKALGCDFKRAKVGDRYVLELLQQNGWLLGGEASGHILCLDKHTTGDGIVSALQVLAALRGSGPLPGGLHAGLPGLSADSAQRAGGQGLQADGQESVRGRSRRWKRNWAIPAGWCCVLPAPNRLIRVMVEGQDETQVRRTAEHIADAVRMAAGV